MRAGVISVGFVLVAAACGGSGGTTSTPATSQVTSAVTTTSAPVVTEAPPNTTTTVPSLDRIREATVRVEATGTFVDPFFGVQANVPGSGSAFIVDPSGIAVTNNHVVTGAGILNVYVGGESEPRNARVLGVSECSDIAVLDIAGDGFTALEWYEGDITAGLEILAAGFPLGDPEYTLLDGIISKEDADGETSWASVDFVIEHTADTLPGNSGGPLVTRDGEVVGANYAGNELGQAFAIGGAVVRPIVDQILAGIDVDGIGVNGEAVADSLTGIWVYSVESGSPADTAGIKGGDLIVAMEGIELAADGTMASYCDVLRSHGPQDVLSVEVYRAEESRFYEGQINGSELVLAAGQTIDDPPPDDGLGGTVVRADLPAAEAYFDFIEFTDDSGAITVTAPAAWTDVNGLSWDYRELTAIGPALSVAPDLEAWVEGWATPGFFIAASTELGITPVELLADEDFSGDCDYAGTEDYNDGFYVGLMDVWQNCGDEGSEFLVVAAQPPDGSYIVLVQIVEVTEADVGAADQVLLSFFVDGPAAG